MITYILTSAIIALCASFAAYVAIDTAKTDKETNLLIKQGENLLKQWGA